MLTKVYHGTISPDDVARKLVARFNHGNYRAQKIGSGERVVVQIATRKQSRSGGHTATTVTLQQTREGVSVQLGKQDWLGVAASLGMTTLSAFRNPFSLIGRLDDIAQDIKSIQLQEQILDAIEHLTHAAGVSHQLSEKLRRTVCGYCNSANEIGVAQCVACGGPTGDDQPHTCGSCGFVVDRQATTCPNCKTRLK
jgi:hypothetical protein